MILLLPKFTLHISPFSYVSLTGGTRTKARRKRRRDHSPSRGAVLAGLATALAFERRLGV
jgi:hypothetical protein